MRRCRDAVLTRGARDVHDDAMLPVPPRTLPELHRRFLDRAIEVLSADPRIVGVAAAGSYADDHMDEYSDIDLVIAVAPDAHAAVLAERHQIASSIAPLVAAFTGEHVGEPRVLICLYHPPLLHVDLKFVALADAAQRVDDPAVLWERGAALSEVMQQRQAHYPAPDPQWIEDRFWVWVHYAAAKIGRGELFEALGFLAFLRARVLSPMALVQLGLRPSGVRRIEQTAPQLATRLAATVAAREPSDIRRAVHAAIAVYRELRAQVPTELELRSAAEAAAVEYLTMLRIAPE
jgi:predicted nucleotidyltransferase